MPPKKTQNGTPETAAEPAVAPDSKFPPRSIVLAKVKGYPPWPAMVLDYELLPEYVQKKKPKTAKTGGRGRGKPVEVIPVRFFSDDTYIWTKTSDLAPLTADQIETFLSKPKRRKDNVLEAAYQLALDPLDMEVFVRYGSKGEPKEPELLEINEDEEEEYVDDGDDDDESDGEEVEDDVEDDNSNDSDSSSGSEDEDDEEDLESVESVDGDDDDEGFVPYKKQKTNKRKAKAKRARSRRMSPPPAKKAAPKRGRPKAVDGDPDWGLEVDLEKNLLQQNYIYEDIEEQRRFNEALPSAEEVAKRYAQISAQFESVSKTLIALLLGEDIKQEDVARQVKKLSGIRVPLSMFMKSKLMRVMVVTMRKPEEVFQYPKVRRSVGDYLKKFGINIEPNPLVIEEAETEREDTEEAKDVKEESSTPKLASEEPTNGN